MVCQTAFRRESNIGPVGPTANHQQGWWFVTLLVEQMAKQEKVTEQLKERDQMRWVQRMNCIRARAEEIVREEIIYTL